MPETLGAEVGVRAKEAPWGLGRLESGPGDLSGRSPLPSPKDFFFWRGGDERAIFPPLMFWKFSFSLFAFVFLGGRTESFKFSLYKEQVDRVNSLVLYDF